jgi:hypothetical protein
VPVDHKVHELHATTRKAAREHHQRMMMESSVVFMLHRNEGFVLRAVCGLKAMNASFEKNTIVLKHSHFMVPWYGFPAGAFSFGKRFVALVRPCQFNTLRHNKSRKPTRDLSVAATPASWLAGRGTER